MPDYRYRTLKRALPSDQNALFNSVFILHEKVHGREQTVESVSDVLCQCYELAAESTPANRHHMTEESELIALRATTLINCWVCSELGHAANCCPNNTAHARWKEGKVKVKLAPINLPPRLVPFVFDSGMSCVMVNSTHYGKGWRDMEQAVSITTADGRQLSATKMGGTVSLLSFSPKMWRWEQMMYQNCLLDPNLVTNLIGTKSVTHAQGKVTFKNELVTVQDKHGHAIQVPTTGDGYPAAAMIIWDNSMPEPAISLAFAAETMGPGRQCRTRDKAALWHRRLGHASYDVTLRMQTVTLAHDIPSSPPTHPGILCDVCVQSKDTTRTPAHPREVKAPLELVSMDVMGPLHGATKFTYVLIIHDAYSSMTWVQGLTNKSQASQEAVWWFSEICVTTHQILSEVIFDHRLKEVCIDQAGATRGHITPFELFYGKRPELYQLRRFGCVTYVILRGNTQSTWLHNHPVVSKHLQPHTLCGTYLGFSDAPRAVKGHWQLESGAAPSHLPFLTGDNEFLCSYTWLPQDDDSAEMGLNDYVPPSLIPYSRQRGSTSRPTSSDSFSYNQEWDCIMAEIEVAGEIVVDLDAIAADLDTKLDTALTKGGNMLQVPTQTADPGDVPLLQTPRTTCSETQATTLGNHHLNRMAFTAMVMKGTALVTSGQQLCSADGILLEPLSLNEAKSHDDWDKWQEAMINEMMSMNKMDVFKLADIPPDGKLIGVCWVFKLKLNAQRQATQYKAQLVAQGTVFLNGKIDKDVHVQIPLTFETKENDGKCYKLKKALYGLKQAGRLWHAALDEQLQAFGSKCCRTEPCVYTRGSSDAMVLLVVYIDDLLIIGATTSWVQSVQQQLSSVFSITDQASVSHIIGLSVQYKREERTLSIDQSGYIEGILVKFGMNEAWTASTPATEAINCQRLRA
ncbi:uncharacterized protein UHOD_11381 [Ustilago sp. UG-2017b]|nr:uncharacterized protein UHOD_11381 [Ustilago sp. UG-2017b]